MVESPPHHSAHFRNLNDFFLCLVSAPFGIEFILKVVWALCAPSAPVVGLETKNKVGCKFAVQNDAYKCELGLQTVVEFSVAGSSSTR